LPVCEGAMRKSILALLGACAVACTPSRDQVPAYAVSIFPVAESTRSPANGHDWKSDRCDYSITFSGVPIDVSKEVPQSNLSYVYSMQYIENNIEGNYKKYSEDAQCACPKNNGTPSNITKYQSAQAFGGAIKTMDYSIVKSSFIETSPLGKFAEFEATSPSMMGEIIARMRIYYGKQCIFVVTTEALRAGDDAPRAIAFLNSARNPNVPQSLPVANPPPQANDAASRLKALKDLLDQKLITPVQYEAKRQAIIDGM